MRRTTEERFWEKVALPDANGCMDWLGARQTSGYGRFWNGERVDGAHRFAFESAHGPIPEGFDVDHACSRPPCVAPNHLEAVSHLENVRRGRASEAQIARHAAQTVCKYGHEFTPENTYLHPAGARVCLPCRRTYQRNWRAARRSGS